MKFFVFVFIFYFLFLYWYVGVVVLYIGIKWWEWSFKEDVWGLLGGEVGFVSGV